MEKNLCKCTVGSGQQGGRPGWAAMQKVPPPLPSLLRPSYSSPPPPRLLLQFPPRTPAPPAPPPFGSMVGASGGRPQANMHCTPIFPLPPQNCILSPHKQYLCQNLQKTDINSENPFPLMIRIYQSALLSKPACLASSHLHLPKLSLTGKVLLWVGVRIFGSLNVFVQKRRMYQVQRQNSPKPQ